MATTLILGASTSVYRYSNLAAIGLIKKGSRVILIGKSGGSIKGVPILKSWPENENIDIITIYLSPENQKTYVKSILESSAKRIIFNPGSENSELKEQIRNNKKEVVRACTLVLINTGQYWD